MPMFDRIESAYDHAAELYEAGFRLTKIHWNEGEIADYTIKSVRPFEDIPRTFVKWDKMSPMLKELIVLKLYNMQSHAVAA